MAFPRRLLSQAEELIFDLRPHWIALAWPVLVTILDVAACAAILIFLPDSWPTGVRWAVVAIGIGLFLAIALPRFVRWGSSHFVVTSDWVIHRSGFVAKHSMEIPLENISDVRFHQGAFERLIGAGDLILESPGEFGQTTFDDVRRPEHVQKTIYEASDQNQRTMVAPASVSSLADELAKLDDLRRRGVISDQEFDAQKARLLTPG